MVAITKDERRVNRAQSLYNEGLDKYLDMIEQIDKDIVEICDKLHGYALGKEDEKYQLTNQQYNALKDQLNKWKAHVENPDKILSQIKEGLRVKHNKDSNPDNSSKEPKVAQFSSKAN